MKTDFDFTPKQKAAIIKESLQEGIDEKILAKKYDIPVRLLREWTDKVLAGIGDLAAEMIDEESLDKEQLKVLVSKRQKLLAKLWRENKYLRKTLGIESPVERALRKPGK